MNRDAVLATLIGFGIGLLITGLLLVGPNLLKAVPRISFPKNTTTPAPTPTPKTVSLTIESPIAETIENSPELLVSGTAQAGATVIIAGPSDESAVTAGADGTFAGKITLVEGKNDIIVTSLSGAHQSEQRVTVYYTQENI